MDWNTPDLNSWPAKLVVRVGKAFRSNKSFTQAAIDRNNTMEAARREKRRQQHAAKNGYSIRSPNDTRRSANNDVNELGEREYSAFSEATTLVDQQHPTDHTVKPSLA
jgi:hypothetical protein